MNPIEDSSVLFKQKRDEYLVEIRKKKNTDFIKSKRTKIANLNPNNSGTSDQSNEPSIPITELAQAFMGHYTTGNINAMPDILEALRKAVSLDDAPPITELMKTTVVPYIVDLLRPDLYKYEKLMIEASWIAINIVSRESEHTNYLVGLDIIPRAISLLEHPHEAVRDNALWILANLSGESLMFRDDILKRGVVAKLEYLLSTTPGSSDTAVTVVWLMSNLCRGKPFPDFPTIAPFLPYLQVFIKNNEDEEVQLNCMWALVYLTEVDDEQQLQEVINMQVFPELIKNLSCNNQKILTPTLRVIGHIVNGTDAQAESIIKTELVATLYPLLSHEAKVVVKETVWVFSNILAGTRSQALVVFQWNDGKIIDKLFSLVREGTSSISEECIYALTNACNVRDITAIGALVDLDMIELLIHILKLSTDASILTSCLQALFSILGEGLTLTGEVGLLDNPYFLRVAQVEGLFVIESLQESSNEEVAEAADQIVKQYAKIFQEN